MSPSGEQSARLAPGPGAPRVARGMVDALRLDHETAETVRLIVSELVSNAVRHGSGPVEVALARRADGVLVRVGDEGTGFAPRGEPVMPPPSSPGGRGLALVALLSERWGVEPGEPTRVWCVVPAAA